MQGDANFPSTILLVIEIVRPSKIKLTEITHPNNRYILTPSGTIVSLGFWGLMAVPLLSTTHAQSHGIKGLRGQRLITAEVILNPKFSELMQFRMLPLTSDTFLRVQELPQDFRVCTEP